MDTKHYLRLLRTFALAALTAAATAACSDDIDNGNEPLTPPDGDGGIPVTFTADINPGSDANPAGAPDTRTVLHPTGNGGFTVTWEGTDNYELGDQIHIWAAKGNALANDGKQMTYLATTSAASSALIPQNDQNKLTLPSTGEWKFTAVYGSNRFTIGFLAPVVYLSNLKQSKPNDTRHIAYRDFSVATAQQMIQADNEMPRNINLRFKHWLSALQLHVTNATDADLTVEEIRLALDDDKIDDFRIFDVTTEDWKPGSETKVNYLKIDITTPEALAPNATPQDFHMLLFSGYAGKPMTITVVTNRGEYTLKKTAPANSGFIAGKNYMTDIIINSSNLTDTATWSEYVNISNADKLAAFRNNVNNGTNNYQGKIVRLLNNITLSGTWTPIGTQAKPFSGTFDGDGHSISGLNVNTTENYAGLFGYVDGGKVRNLRVKGNVTTTGSNAGGIAGYITQNSTVENCIFDGTVSGKEKVGGIAGTINSGCQVTGCYTSSGTVEATSAYAGGIVGTNTGLIADCYSSAEVKAEADYYAGGITGYNSSAVTRCYATGAIHAKGYAGGIAGLSNGGTFTGCIALNPSLTRTEGNGTAFGRIVGGNTGEVNTNCGAFDGMTFTAANGTDISANVTGSNTGDALTREQCLTKSTYTDRGFTDANGWKFNSETWTYLPWNKVFDNWDLTMKTYRISVPAHLTSGGTVN